MKLSFLFLVVLLGLTTAVPTGKVTGDTTHSLSDDLNDFLVFIPTEEVLEIVIRYLAEDEEVQAAVAYTETDDFKNLILAVEAIPEYIECLNALQAAGLDIYKWINTLHSFLGLDELVVPDRSISERSVPRITGGLAGIFADIKAVLPVDEIKGLYHRKLETSEDFASLIAFLGSEEFVARIHALKDNEQLQIIVTTLTTATGVDVDAIRDFLATILFVPYKSIS